MVQELITTPEIVYAESYKFKAKIILDGYKPLCKIIAAKGNSIEEAAQSDNFRDKATEVAQRIFSGQGAKGLLCIDSIEWSNKDYCEIKFYKPEEFLVKIFHKTDAQPPALVSSNKFLNSISLQDLISGAVEIGKATAISMFNGSYCIQFFAPNKDGIVIVNIGNGSESCYFKFRYRSEERDVLVNAGEGIDSVISKVDEAFGLDAAAGIELYVDGSPLPLNDMSSVPQGTVIDVVEKEPPAPPTSDDPIYKFQYEEDEFELSIPAGATVFDVKQIIAKKHRTISDYVSLLFCGRNLKDGTLLIHQRIGVRKIIVYIRRFDAILLESIGYGSSRGTSRPPNFSDLVARLEHATGQDNRTCIRCLTYYDYDYDYDQALQELLKK